MSLYLRGEVWYMDFVVGGKRITRSTGEKSKRQALLKFYEARREVELNAERPDLGVTLGDAIERAIREHWATKRNRSAELVARKLGRLLGTEMPLGDVTGQTFSELQAKLVAEGRSTATVNRYFSALSTVMRIAKTKWGLGVTRPDVEFHREASGRIRTVSEEELAALVEWMSRSYYPQCAQLAVVLIDTGLRLGEALRLEWRDVDLEAASLTMWDQKGGGANPSRTIPLTRRVVDTLKAMRTQTEDRRVFWALDHDHCQRAMKQWHAKGGDPEVCWHALRHTFASRLVQRGVSLYVVKSLMGHSTIGVTERYAHLDRESMRGAISKLEGGAG